MAVSWAHRVLFWSMECGGRGGPKEGSSTSPLGSATVTLPLPPFCVLRMSTGPANRVRGRETGDAALLTGRMEGGAASQDAVPLEAGKAGAEALLGASQEDLPASPTGILLCLR